MSASRSVELTLAHTAIQVIMGSNLHNNINEIDEDHLSESLDVEAGSVQPATAMKVELMPHFCGFQREDARKEWVK